MSESIASHMYRKYKVSINAAGVWHDGGIKMNFYGYSVVVFGVTLKSSKSYKRYGGAQLAAKKLIKKLELKGV